MIDSNNLGPQKTRLNYILAILVITIAGVYFLIYCYHGINILRFPFDLEIGDGYFLYQVFRLFDGQPLYPPLNEYPFIVTAHPPLYPAVSATLIPLVGKTFLAGRLVNFLAALLIGLLIYGIVKGETRNTYLGALSALLFFASNFIYELAAYMRPDSLAVLLGLAGVFIAYRYQDSPKVYLAVIPLLLAVYTIQTAITASAAVVIFLLLKNKRVSMKMAAALFLSIGGVFLLLNLQTGWEFLAHLFLYPAARESSLAFLLHRSLWFFSLHAVILGFSFTYLLLSAWRRQPSIWAIYFLVSLAITTYLAYQRDAPPNYYFETIAIACVLTGQGIHKLLKEFRLDFLHISPLNTAILCLLLIQLVMFLHFPPAFDPQSTYPRAGHTPTAEQLATTEKVNRYVQDAKGEVYMEEWGFALLNKKNVWIDAHRLSFTTHPDAEAALKRFRTDIENRKFSLIILSYHLQSAEVERAINQNYQLIDELPNTDVASLPSYIFRPGYPPYKISIYTPLTPITSLPATLYPTYLSINNGSFEDWQPSPQGFPLPEHWVYVQDEEGGSVEKSTDTYTVIDGTASVKINPSSRGNSMLRYEIPDIKELRGGFIRFSVWVKSQNTAADAIQIDVQDLIGIPIGESYSNNGEWEQLVVQRYVDPLAERILLTINVKNFANDNAYLDGATLMMSQQ